MTKIKLTALLLAAPLLSSSYTRASEPGKFDRKFQVSGPVNLDIKSGPGGINVTVGSSDAVVVHAIIRSSFGRVDFGIAEANIRALEQNPPLEQRGNAIRIGYVTDEATLRGVSVTYEIQTPRETQVHASADAGGIRIDGVQGPVNTVNVAGHSEVSGVKDALQMTARSGGIVVRDAGANVSLHNESGGVQAQDIHGGVDAETTSGRIEISGVFGNVHSTTHSASIHLDGMRGAVNAHNESGNIEVVQSSGPIRVETASGSIRISQSIPASIYALSGSGAIHVHLASGGGYQLDVQSMKGEISGRAIGAFPMTKNQHSLKGKIGSGGPLVSLQSRSSKIDID